MSQACLWSLSCVASKSPLRHFEVIICRAAAFPFRGSVVQKLLHSRNIWVIMAEVTTNRDIWARIFNSTSVFQLLIFLRAFFFGGGGGFCHTTIFSNVSLTIIVRFTMIFIFIEWLCFEAPTWAGRWFGSLYESTIVDWAPQIWYRPGVA